MLPVAVSLHSIKSGRSPKSDKSGKSNVTVQYGDSDIDFADFMIETCKIFNCPVPIAVTKECQRDEIQRIAKTRLGKVKSKRTNIISPDEVTITSDVTVHIEHLQPVVDRTLTISTKYDILYRLTDILITKYYFEPVPRIMIKVMTLIISNFSQLTKFTIKNCCIDMYTIYELSKMLPISTITDLCLDTCPLPQANYDIILSESSCLKSLSLCRCKINDEVCQRIASSIIYLEPAEEHLAALNLTSNHITDVGAKYLAVALRSNRHLRYLNLADNLLSDDGANHIFNILKEFPMTYDEIMEMRYRYMLYLKKKRVIYLECLQKFGMPSPTPISPVPKKYPTAATKRAPTATLKNKTMIKKDKLRKPSLSDNIPLKAEMMTRELLGPFIDPFNSINVKIENGYTYCIGNFTLCYLNVAYNNLTYVSVKKLLSILEYQEGQKKGNMCGLVKVTFDGNYVPANCTELTTINQILLKHITACSIIKQLSERGSSTRKSLSERKGIR